MKPSIYVDYISDLHLDARLISCAEKEERYDQIHSICLSLFGEHRKRRLLIVAGDVSSHMDDIFLFLDYASDIYDDVLYVIGNHERYLSTKEKKSSLFSKEASIRYTLEKMTNVHMLEGDIFTYQGKRIGGSSLWYYPEGEKDSIFFWHTLNDAPMTTPYQMDQGRVLIEFHEKAEAEYEKLKGKDLDLMVSHYPPLHVPDSPYPPNSCFYFKTDELVASKWVCGHVHTKSVFERAGTTFYLNPAGYAHEQDTPVVETLLL